MSEDILGRIRGRSRCHAAGDGAAPVFWQGDVGLRHPAYPRSSRCGGGQPGGRERLAPGSAACCDYGPRPGGAVPAISGAPQHQRQPRNQLAGSRVRHHLYAVVWIAACGYTLATFPGTTIGAARTAGLYATSIGILLVFTLMLVSSALRNRERYYFVSASPYLHLARRDVAPDHRPTLQLSPRSLLHGCWLPDGCKLAIQWVQLREAGSNHAAD